MTFCSFFLYDIVEFRGLETGASTDVNESFLCPLPLRHSCDRPSPTAGPGGLGPVEPFLGKVRVGETLLFGLESGKKIRSYVYGYLNTTDFPFNTGVPMALSRIYLPKRKHRSQIPTTLSKIYQ